MNREQASSSPAATSAFCDACGGEMATAPSCALLPLTIRGAVAPRVPYGDEPGLRSVLAAQGMELRPHCWDCGTPVGALHHPGCTAEACPGCGGQAFGCDCLDSGEAA